jgi:diguanylate cyclase (GGDEF)-like protein/PAS domain S-box-containing protein
MTFNYTPYIYPFIASSITIVALWLFTIQYRDELFTRAFWGLLLAIFIWSTCFIFEIMGTELHTKILFANIKFLGINAIPIAFLILTIQNTDNKQKLGNWSYALGAFYLTATTVIWTDSFHHWFRQAPHLETVNDGFQILVNDYGFWYYKIQIPIHYLILLLTLRILIQARFFSSRSYRSQSGILLLSFMIPFVVDILYNFGITPIQNFNFTSAIFSISGILIVYALYHHRLFDIVPMANDLIVNNFAEGVVVLDLQERVIGINPSACKIIRTNSRDALGKPVKNILWFADDPAFNLSVEQKALTFQHNELDGIKHYYDVTNLSIKNHRNKMVGTLITIRDVTERHLSLIEARILATTDSLTGAFNRRHFIEYLEAELARSALVALPLAVIMFDIDNFKQFNDNYGHAVGDEILIMITKISRANLRSFDLVGRHGGDEFVILLPQANPALATSVAERLCRLISELQITANNENISVTISMGVTGYHGQGKVTADKLLQSADIAMYQAKENGKNQFRVFGFGD